MKGIAKILSGRGALRVCALGIALLFFLSGAACAPGTGGRKRAVVKECVLPQDQQGSLIGRWKVTPIPIAVEAGKFDASEIADLVKAADVWNRFYEASLGIKVLDYGTAANFNQSSAVRTQSICATGIVQGNQFSGQVVIYKMAFWPYTNRGAIAVTTSCRIPASPLTSFFHGMMELNYDDFFSAGRQIPDLTSIMIHEFGHLLGLDHSCHVGGKTGFPDCNNLAMPSDYRDATLFPVVFFDEFGIGQLRRSLNENDEGRGNCLYKDLADAKK